LPIAPKFKQFEVIPTKVITMLGSVTGSDAEILALANAALSDPVAFPGGTIMLVRMDYTINIGTSNGSQRTVSNNIGMAVRLFNGSSAGAWVRSQGPN